MATLRLPRWGPQSEEGMCLHSPCHIGCPKQGGPQLYKPCCIGSFTLVGLGLARPSAESGPVTDP